MSEQQLQAICQGLNGITTEEGFTFCAVMVKEGDVTLAKVEVEDREEFPIFISLDDDQLVCMTYLWPESEVKTERRGELLEAMLTMNVPMPLSSFGKVGDQYLIFGAMANNSEMAEIQHELMVLSDNTLSAVELFTDYLN